MRTAGRLGSTRVRRFALGLVVAVLAVSIAQIARSQFGSTRRCRPFSASSAWNTPATSVSATPAGITTGWANSGLWTPSVFHGNSRTMPLVPVRAPAGWGWPAATLHLPIPPGARPTNDGDAEMVIVDDATGRTVDLWAVSVTPDGSYSARTYAQSNIKAGTGFGSGERGAGVRAIGSSALGGLLLGCDFSRRVVDHALAISLPDSLVGAGHVAPAISSDADGSGPVRLGQRLAIPRSTPKPSSLTPAGSLVWDALSKYGAIVSDTSDGGNAVLYLDAVSTNSTEGSQLQKDATSLLSALHLAG